MNTVRILLTAVIAAGAVVLPVAGASAATPNPGPAFGQHVSEYARTMAFSGTHNPGLHQGGAGWDGMTCTMP